MDMIRKRQANNGLLQENKIWKKYIVRAIWLAPDDLLVSIIFFCHCLYKADLLVFECLLHQITMYNIQISFKKMIDIFWFPSMNFIHQTI